MATVERQAVRARVEIWESLTGLRITVETPYVMSFSVTKARGKMTADFSASLKIPYDELTSSSELLADRIVIKAGLRNDLKTVFTGKIKKAVMQPVRTDASKVILNITGQDVLSVMEGQKINRRLKTYREISTDGKTFLDGSTPPEKWGMVNDIVKPNTIRTQRFRNKVYTPEKMGVYDLKNTVLLKTPDAFRYEEDIIRERAYKTKGGLSIEKVN